MIGDTQQSEVIVTRESRVVLKLSLAIFGGLFLQASTIIWWASKLDYRVTVIEQAQGQNAQMIERVTRVEEKVSSIQAQTAKIDDMRDELRSVLNARSDRPPTHRNY